MLNALVGCADVDRPSLDEVACLGHRGHVTDAVLENTHASFLAAYNIGGDGTEFDVYHSRDNVAMVFHDRTLAGLARSKPGQQCPFNLGIPSLSFAELRTRCELINGDEIPTLESVLQRFNATSFKLYLEFKDPIHADTLTLLHTYYPVENDDRLQATSFLKDMIQTPLWELDPRFPLMFAHRRYVTGMENGFDGVDVGEISIPDIRRLQMSGKRVGVYGVDSAQDIRRALSERVHYITTDDLPLCVQLKQEALDARD